MIHMDMEPAPPPVCLVMECPGVDSRYDFKLTQQIAEN